MWTTNCYTRVLNKVQNRCLSRSFGAVDQEVMFRNPKTMPFEILEGGWSRSNVGYIVRDGGLTRAVVAYESGLSWLVDNQEKQVKQWESGIREEGSSPMRVVFCDWLMTKECRLNGEIRWSEKMGGPLWERSFVTGWQRMKVAYIHLG